MEWFSGNQDPFSPSTSLKFAKSLHELVAEAVGKSGSSFALEEEGLKFHSHSPDDERLIETATLPEIASEPPVGVARKKRRKLNQDAAAEKHGARNRRKPPAGSVDTAASELEEAYAEIKKFALAGMQGNEKHEARERLALQLGAKPKKKRLDNYKELKVARREEKQKQTESRAEDRHYGVKKSKRQTKGAGKNKKSKKSS